MRQVRRTSRPCLRRWSEADWPQILRELALAGFRQDEQVTGLQVSERTPVLTSSGRRGCPEFQELLFVLQGLLEYLEALLELRLRDAQRRGYPEHVAIEARCDSHQSGPPALALDVGRLVRLLRVLVLDQLHADHEAPSPDVPDDLPADLHLLQELHRVIA